MRGTRHQDRRYRGRYTNQEPIEEKDAFEANWNQKTSSFEDMNLKSELLHGIYSYGFKDPSEIQQLAITPIINGRHVIAQAQTGSGKTGAFVAGILQKINLELNATQTIIISPTRELTDQSYSVCQKLGHYMKGLKVGRIMGGIPIQENITACSNGPHVLMATPGKLIDMMVNKYLDYSNVSILCMDEADQLLSEGFLEQSQEIMGMLNTDTQLILFSATYTSQLIQQIEQSLGDPIKILVPKEKLTIEGIKQFYVDVGEDIHKMETLFDIYGQISIQKAIIFVNTTRCADYIAKQFAENGFPVGKIHSGLVQTERDEVMYDFRTGKFRLLITTDLLGRGIDVQQITLIINFEMPESPEKYIHRIGRTAHSRGREGVVVNISNSSDIMKIRQISTLYKAVISELPSDIAQIVKSVK